MGPVLRENWQKLWEKLWPKIWPKLWRTVGDFLVGGLLVWLSYAMASGLWEVIERGTIKNRRGPDIDVSENPLVFWGLSGFFGLGTILVGGLTVLCLCIAVANLARK